jgi:hypothetical protein
MGRSRSGILDDQSKWIVLSYPNAELGLLATERSLVEPAELRAIAADLVQDLSSQSHRGTEGIADLLTGDRNPAVSTADHPVELGRKPTRLLALPLRRDGRPNRHDQGIEEILGHA